MQCTQCGCEIDGRGRREGGQVFCSLECSYAAEGLDTDEEEGYFEEEPVDFHCEEDEE
ncbi:MAG: hypothetical protein KOO62_10475 [candidate division Zixibacteria bacterium]|nr:hypothetical protein [candidate division Zixibacteria bacterium]